MTEGNRTRRGPADERLHRKRQLAATLRIFARLGFDEGAGGHVTARDPEQPDHFWINPFGLHFGLVCASDLLLVDAAGAVVQTGRSRHRTINPAGYAIHSHIHSARPDVVAAAHTHSIHGRAWSTTGRLLDPITQDACAFYQDHALYDAYGGVADEEEGKRIAAALGARRAVILRNHGLLTVGASVGEAAWWFISMERCCQVQLLAEAVGPPVLIGHAEALGTYATIGTPGVGRINFRPMYDEIVHRQPDLLD
ncbi:class II aldolase/adducin family protein [Micromonospora sp. FIMYZ51]|uniref:class II aldolase/adducin family protein n=1 Tax=Micromonospora sp. FIMYZ51 TaxID=3051832 RepID=UPI00311EAF7A